MDFAAFERMTAEEADEFLRHYLQIESYRMPSLVAADREAGLAADFTVEKRGPAVAVASAGHRRVLVAPDEPLPAVLDRYCPLVPPSPARRCVTTQRRRYRVAARLSRRSKLTHAPNAAK